MDCASTPGYGFGGFHLDVVSECLTNAEGALLPLHSRACATLRYLIEHQAELVDKHELMGAVWPHTVVCENNLNQCILQLRRLLGDTPAGRRFILTVPGRGFKFIAPVEVALRATGPATPRAGTSTALLPRSLSGCG